MNGNKSPTTSLFGPSITKSIRSNVKNMKNGANNVIKNVGSFITAPAIQNSIKDIAKPIQESIKLSNNNSVSPFISIPLIIGLGALIILITIIAIFRVQIANGIELLWNTIKNGISPQSSQSSSQSPPSFESEQNLHNIDTNALNKILPGKKEVFNIANNKYKFSDAEPLCKAFGAELATYDQVKSAWNNGADWCNYGWIKGQAAVYPTQEETYNKLQNGPEDQRMSCGTVGVNGGYFDNPDMNFGVNCYGDKPSENQADISNIMSTKISTQQTLEYDRKVADFKAKRDEIPVSPFKPGTW